MRQETKRAVDEYHHVFNRGVGKRQLFFDADDYLRFLFSLIYYQSPTSFENTHRYIAGFKGTHDFGVDDEIADEIVATRYVELVNFAIMPNHFHLTVGTREEDGLGRYMQRVLTSYARYFNIKYNSRGHLFESSYQAVHVSTNEQLLYLSAYIHKNPQMHASVSQIKNFPWSSLPDYLIKNRWGDLLMPGIILNQFDEPEEYYTFLKESTAKEIKEHLFEV